MEKNDILLAPLKAFRFTPETDPENPQTTLAPQTGKGEKVVWLQTAEGIVPKVIKVGVSDGIYTEVKEGIQEGSRLIVGVQRNKKMAPQGGNPTRSCHHVRDKRRNNYRIRLKSWQMIL